jgi:hypothetical protein
MMKNIVYDDTELWNKFSDLRKQVWEVEAATKYRVWVGEENVAIEYPLEDVVRALVKLAGLKLEYSPPDPAPRPYFKFVPTEEEK